MATQVVVLVLVTLQANVCLLMCHPTSWRTYPPKFVLGPQFCPETGGTICTAVDYYPIDRIHNLLTSARSQYFNLTSLFVDERKGDVEPNYAQILDQPPYYQNMDGYGVNKPPLRGPYAAGGGSTTDGISGTDGGNVHPMRNWSQEPQDQWRQLTASYGPVMPTSPRPRNGRSELGSTASWSLNQTPQETRSGYDLRPETQQQRQAARNRPVGLVRYDRSRELRSQGQDNFDGPAGQGPGEIPREIQARYQENRNVPDGHNPYEVPHEGRPLLRENRNSNNGQIPYKGQENRNNPSGQIETRPKIPDGRNGPARQNPYDTMGQVRTQVQENRNRPPRQNPYDTSRDLRPQIQVNRNVPSQLHKTKNLPSGQDGYQQPSWDARTQENRNRAVGQQQYEPEREVNSQQSRFTSSTNGRGRRNQDIELACEVRSTFVYPRAALSDHSEWKFIVNVAERDERFRQVVRVDICQNEGRPCSSRLSLPFGFVSHCRQKYIKKKLLSLNPDGEGTGQDNFFIPSCCVCEITRSVK